MHRSSKSRLHRAVISTVTPLITAVGVMVAVSMLVIGAWIVLCVPLFIAYLFAMYTAYSTLILFALIAAGILWNYRQDKREGRVE